MQTTVTINRPQRVHYADRFLTERSPEAIYHLMKGCCLFPVRDRVWQNQYLYIVFYGDSFVDSIGRKPINIVFVEYSCHHEL